MTLTAGTRLGPYRILAPLGAGGMGEVFRARDTRLDRDVAIKVLPQSVANDSAALARFEREAKAVAALSHPNILAIHDVGTSGDTTYAVMELLEGASLRESLGEGPIPQRKALEIAREIALGLAAAHEKGIVHRDLKPENLFLTSDGRVKILDFGLARQLSLPSAGDTHSPTAAQATEPGTVLGTVGYMAPEQLRGQPADARSDIFSFGAVLYEMCSSRRAFKGDTAIETMNAILKEDPPEMSVSGHAVAPAVERIVRHCLEKNPAERFQSARDLAFGLASLSVSSASGVTSGGAAPGRPRLAVPALAAAVAALAVLAAGGLGGWLLSRRTPSGAPEVSFHRLTFRRGNMLSARFAPDGQTVVYSATWEGVPAEIFTVRTDGIESRPLGLPKADVCAVSSKGELAVLLKKDNFFRSNTSGTLARVPLNGGTPREVLEDVTTASWAPNGEDLAVIRRSGGQRHLEYPIGKTLAKARLIFDGRVSPGGDRIAVAEQDAQAKWSILVFDSKGGKRTLVSGLSDVSGLAWSPRGNEILYVGGPTRWQQALRAVSLDGRGRVLLPGGGFTLHDVSSSGRILIEKGNLRFGVACLPRGESREREVSWLDGSWAVDISPDGQLVLFLENGEGQGPKMGAFLRRADGAPAVRLGDGEPIEMSADGKWVVTIQAGPPGRLVLLPTGAGAAKTISTDGVEPDWGRLLPDGKGFLVAALKTDGQIEYSTVPPEGGKPRPIPASGFGRYNGTISPDGDRLLYVAKDRSIRIVPIAGGEERKVPGDPLARGDYPVQWDSDGRTLYVWTYGSLPAAVDKLDLTTGRRQPWKQLMPADRGGVISIENVVISRDGGSYAYTHQRATDSDLFVVDGLLK